MRRAYSNTELQFYIDILKELFGLNMSSYDKIIENLAKEFDILTDKEELNRLFKPLNIVFSCSYDYCFIKFRIFFTKIYHLL